LKLFLNLELILRAWMVRAVQQCIMQPQEVYLDRLPFCCRGVHLRADLTSNAIDQCITQLSNHIPPLFDSFTKPINSSSYYNDPLIFFISVIHQHQFLYV
uniref:Secreted protein n=1 Tax=Anisakis simplex TaxID=6269 RepID=A0A0M3JLZ5_ANISI